jgi:hypothetical protein
MVQADVPLYEVQKILGYSLTALTEGYAHLARSSVEGEPRRSTRRPGQQVSVAEASSGALIWIDLSTAGLESGLLAVG